jgi:biotin carboxylase
VADYFSRGFEPAVYSCDLGFVADPVELSVALRAANVGRVVAGTESGVVLTDTLNHLLSLPGDDPATRTARRDKAAMARTVAAAGLAVPAGAVFGDAVQARDWYAGSGLREVVVKPLRSAGSDHVRFCADAASVQAAAVAVLSSTNLYGERNDEVLVQERLVGTEYYLNTVSHEGIHAVAEVWRYSKLEGPDGAPIYDFEEPLGPDDDVVHDLKRFVFLVLDALGVRSSAAHTEVMVTAGGPVLIECGARLGGATMPEVVEKYTGASQAGLLVQALLDPTAVTRFDDGWAVPTASVRNVSLINPTAGAVRSQRWRAGLESLPTLVAMAVSLPTGTHLGPTVDLLSSPGYVYLAAEAPEDVLRDHAQLRRLERSGIYTS